MLKHIGKCWRAFSLSGCDGGRIGRRRQSVEKIYHSTPSARPLSAPPEL